MVAVRQARLAHTNWPTLALFFGAATAFALALVLALNHLIPLWAGMLINTVVAYAMYTPLHEAAHGLICCSTPLRLALNDWIGRIAGLTALVAFDAFRVLHVNHHRYVNDPQRDPDYWLPKTTAWLVPLNVFAGFYHNYVQTMRLARETGDNTGAIASRGRWLIVTTGLLISFAFGHATEFLLLWIVPGILGLSAILLVFGWLPHRPFLIPAVPTKPRVATIPQPWGALWAVVSIGQSHHLFHHAFPMLPFYMLPGLYRETARDMAAAGIDIWKVTARGTVAGADRDPQFAGRSGG